MLGIRQVINGHEEKSQEGREFEPESSSKKKVVEKHVGEKPQRVRGKGTPGGQTGYDQRDRLEEKERLRKSPM